MGFTPYSSVVPFLGGGADRLSWYPPEHRERVASYAKYDEIYWNDDDQFALRVLEGENPQYVPNGRTIVDTTAYYLLKGLSITTDAEKSPALAEALKLFLDREMFLAQFHTAKHAGVARGDFCFHLTADPAKAQGTRISINSVYPGNVIPVYDPEDITKLLRVHLIDLWVDPTDPTGKQFVKKLTYEYEGEGDQRIVYREEAIYSLEDDWWGQKPKLLKSTLPRAPLPNTIRTIPIYWFKNIDWGEQEFGSSELRGFERNLQGISQAATDQEASLALEGLGVYATDGGRPVNDHGDEVDWEIAPGKVMEVPTGSYFRRVEGLSTLKPSMDHINYVESKLREAGGISDVALGRVDVQTATSGIALAIKFIPTLAKIDERDQALLGRLKQLFFDWQLWHAAYEGTTLEGEVICAIAEKLPQDRTGRINELNNMFDRDIIPASYYRAEMQKLGYVFPDDIETQLDKEAAKKAEQAAAAAPDNLQANAEAAARGDKPPPSNPSGGRNDQGPTTPPPGNKSNNRRRPNESGGTEANQSAARQARGGTPQKRGA